MDGRTEKHQVIAVTLRYALQQGLITPSDVNCGLRQPQSRKPAPSMPPEDCFPSFWCNRFSVATPQD